MSSQVPHTSAFTFQSAVHSSHVLQRLNEQRQRDVLCDVTVVVQDKSFRAHFSVLASCSEYFHTRVTSVTRQCPLITLPDEVTAEGFEPLLHFAYTSKLLFTKENIHAIHSSADFLGFHNLESACFDFLLPKFSEGKVTPRETRRACCQSCSSKSPTASFNAESTHQATFETRSSTPLGENEQSNLPPQCPQTSQGTGKEELFSLEHCGPQLTPLSLDLTANSVCPMLSMQCTDSSKADHPAQFCERDMLDIGDVCNQSELADCGLPCELQTPGDPNPPELIEPAAGSDGKQSVEMFQAESNCSQSSCPFSGSETDVCSEQTKAGFEQNMSSDLSKASLVALGRKDGFEERSSVEREVAEHLAKGFWPDLCPPQAQDPIEQVKLSKAADFHWLKQLDLSSSVGDCPFFRDLGTSEEPNLNADSMSQSAKSPCVSSFNSGDDSDLDTDGDAEANKRRAAEIQLPFPVEQITALTRSAFQQILKQHELTPEQQEFVHDVRRRSKNRMAAQRCRKRKLDGIQKLECEIKILKSEKERLMQEQSELEQNLEDTRQSLCSLCKNVSI